MPLVLSVVDSAEVEQPGELHKTVSTNLIINNASRHIDNILRLRLLPNHHSWAVQKFHRQR